MTAAGLYLSPYPKRRDCSSAEIVTVPWLIGDDTEEELLVGDAMEDDSKRDDAERCLEDG